MDKISQIFIPENPKEAAALRALDRAYGRQAHAHLFDLHTEGNRVTARYGADVVRGYRVQIAPGCTDCTCKAGQVGMLCLHVAALADRAGCFDALVPGFYARLSPPAVDIESLPPLTRLIPPGFAA